MLQSFCTVHYEQHQSRFFWSHGLWPVLLNKHRKPNNIIDDHVAISFRIKRVVQASMPAPLPTNLRSSGWEMARLCCPGVEHLEHRRVVHQPYVARLYGFGASRRCRLSPLRDLGASAFLL